VACAVNWRKIKYAQLYMLKLISSKITKISYAKKLHLLRSVVEVNDK